MSEFVKRVVKPTGVAMGAAAVIAVLAYLMSRILLAVPEAGSTIIAFLLAAVILFVISVIAMTGSTVKQSQKLVIGFAGISLLGAGVVGQALGVREIEVHLAEFEFAAEGIAFESDTLELPSDTEVALVFTNNDTDPHNVEIYPDDTFSGDALFEGEVFAGPATVTYEVPATPAGEYAFRCVVHPVMAGTAIFSEDVEAGHGGESAPDADDGDAGGDHGGDSHG